MPSFVAIPRGAVLVGTSGWSYPHWRDPVYHGAPPSRWLAAYAEQFDTVEVNSTFYRLPTARAVQRWADETPDGFLFAVKVSRYLTHVRRLTGIDAGLPRLLALLEPLVRAGKLGPLLWQLPGTFQRDDGRLAAALDVLPPGRHAFEFRHPSWFCEPVCRLLRDAGASLVIGDDPRRPFQTLDATAPWRYVRFHHGHRGRRGNYSPAEIETWASRIAGWRSDGDVYAYFNNDWEAFAVANARLLMRRLDRAAAASEPRREAAPHA